MGAKKTVDFSKNGIKNIPNDKPIVYKILTPSGGNNYTGIAKRGRGPDRLAEHLGTIPGAKVQIEQMPSINAAAQKEQNIISRTKPKYNIKGK